MNKARHAYGQSADIASAIQANKINAFDILFLDGDTEPKIGWLDKQGVARIAQGKTQIVRVEELPVADGDENVVYIYNNEGYIWDGTQCVSLAKSADLTTLETQVSTLATQMSDKVDTDTVQSMIEDYSESAYEIVEF